MRFDETYSGKVFIKSHPNYEESKAVLYGMPMDWTVSYRPGSRFGPNKIREVSIGLEEYSPYLDRELGDVKFFDAGDIPLPFGNPEKSLIEIETYVHTLLADHKIPMGMGGEHLVSLPVMKAVASKYDDLAIIHFDAHTDLRENYEGEEYSHSTPIRKIADHIGPKNVYSFGIRSGMKEEFEWAKEQGMHISKFEVLEPLKEVLPTLEGRNVYVTIDMDVLDPAHAPGTGTVDAGGITSRELLASIHAIAASGVNVVGFDLVELAPVYDHSDQTANTASKLMREMILGWVK
ncbi:agmatinase [Microbacterium sp. APC 3898]|uniref:Agmatinase n=2 Tax=Planococcus TaxID=1372 RepID=A0ABT7ZKY7_9BACL|nr:MULTISPECIES: agmatinase [Terrabacteria group]MBF6632682.1 agmatinase [Planococcus sp. (in: firmicutes)]MBD8013254.1 agmatinase [Planococcus wigleyi]MDN3427830.1 agmatinase [Planococcus sp. APC 4016]MDN3437184.1 agmatinase [Planococcus sp. APC 3900]MDN3499382.1 agmatinase [Microbacterium sp. APC 3898]